MTTDPTLSTYASIAFTTLDKAVAEAVIARAGGYCDRCGEVLTGYHLHHRKMKSQGGPDTVTNLMVVSPACHAWIHANPRESYTRGWLIKGWAEPEPLEGGESAW